jgi:hypothetical protein
MKLRLWKCPYLNFDVKSYNPPYLNFDVKSYNPPYLNFDVKSYNLKSVYWFIYLRDMKGEKIIHNMSAKFINFYQY